jgi:hypothetical protein
MGVLASFRTADGHWLVDRVWGEGTVEWRVWEETDGHELAAELPGPIERLREWLTRHRVDLGDLIPIGDEEDDQERD